MVVVAVKHPKRRVRREIGGHLLDLHDAAAGVPDLAMPAYKCTYETQPQNHPKNALETVSTTLKCLLQRIHQDSPWEGLLVQSEAITHQSAE